MATSTQMDSQKRRISSIAPEERLELDSPYTIPTDLYETLRSVLHDVGGQPDVPVPYRQKGEEDWEMNTYVTCECLGWRGAWNSEMRRRAENDLGATLYFGLPYYARWITVASKVLIDRGLITVDELADKIDEVRVRVEGKR